MPGVPPDAVAQLKRGLKGLFSRKKKTNNQDTSASGATQPTNTAKPEASATSPPAAAPATAPVTAAATSATGASNTTGYPVASPTEPSKSTGASSSPPAPVAAPTPVSTKPPAEGMSATSGPLGDSLDLGAAKAPTPTTTEPISEAKLEEGMKDATGEATTKPTETTT